MVKVLVSLVLLVSLFGVSPAWADTAADTEAIRQVVLNHVDANRPPIRPKAVIMNMAIVENYAVVSVVYGEGGGQVALKKDEQGQWQVLFSGGGAMNSSNLIEFGVPENIAVQLIQQIEAQWKQGD